MSAFGCNNNSCNDVFARHICRFIGEVVTVFTTSGGPSGCGFTGTLLSVNHDSLRLVTRFGMPPANPLSEHICDFENGGCDKSFGAFGNTTNGLGGGGMKDMNHGVGSVCDIPIDRIAAFCHNTV